MEDEDECDCECECEDSCEGTRRPVVERIFLTN